MRFHHLLFLVGFLLVGMTACALKPVKIQPINTYTLNQVTTKPLQSQPSEHSLLITPTSAEPGYRTAQMTYVMQPFQLEYYANNQWIAPPAQMITSLLSESFRASNVFKSVTKFSQPGFFDLRLDSQLEQLEQNYRVKPSRINVALFVTLIDNNNNQIMGSKRFSETVITKQDTPYGGVVAANQALAEIATKVVVFVHQKIAMSTSHSLKVHPS